MEELNGLVVHYLKTRTEFALMLSGEWGSGKTYYFDTILKPLIGNQPVFENQSKRYKPVRISLFGIKSIEEIHYKIFIELYPILKDRKLKIGKDIAQLLITAYLKLKGLPDYNKIMSNTKVKPENYLDFKQIVLCFDDIERKSNVLRMEELIGFINSILELGNVKIIIITNEIKITNFQYKLIKEKVIGNTIQFIPNFTQVFDSLVTLNFNPTSPYTNFLKTNKFFISQNFKSSNFRILNYALTYFQQVYSLFQLNAEALRPLKNKENEILLKLLKFTLVISIEYRQLNITYNERNDLDKQDLITSKIIFDDLVRNKGDQAIDSTQSKTFIDSFIEKYYPDETFNFFDSVYNYITGNKIFDFSELLAELTSLYNIINNEVPAEYELFQKLHYHTCFQLSDTEYVELTGKLYDLAIAGSFKIRDYVSIFHFLTRFGNPLNYDLDKLTNDLLVGLKIAKNSSAYERTLSWHLSFNNTAEHYEKLILLRTEILRLNNELLENAKNKEYFKLESILYTDFDLFNEEVSNKYDAEAVLIDFDPIKFFELFVDADSFLKWRITSFVSNRYNRILSELKHELEFLKKVLAQVKEKNTNIPEVNVTGFLFHEFERTLISAIQKLAE